MSAIKWQQRLESFKKAFSQLSKFITPTNLNELEKLGLVKSFEYTYELAWKTLQDFLKHSGYSGVSGPKPVIEQSFQDGYITDGKGWIRMHKSRNLATHTYDEQTATEIVKGIREEYYTLLETLVVKLDNLKEQSSGSIFDN